jgi:hypothetical protein
MLPTCPLSQVLVNSSRASWMIAVRRGLGKVTSRERKAMHPAQLSLYRHFAHPMKEDVKKKILPPPLRG